MEEPYILVLYYSRTGSVKNLALNIAKGVESVSGIKAMVRTVPAVSAVCEQTEPTVPEKDAPYVTLEELQNCAGLACGSPTRFGNMAAPMKYFWDNTAALWFSGALVGKPAAVFSSSTTMHGGQESTLLTMMVPLFHHGMIILGIPYSEKELHTTSTGGTPYGVTHVEGSDHNSDLSKEEDKLAKSLGKRLALTALKLYQSS